MSRNAALLVVASGLLGGCQVFGPDHDSPRTDIERARTAWADQTDGTCAFDLVEDARRRNAAVVEMDFSDHGFPTRINLDYSRQIADDELYIEVENVTTDA